MMIIRRFRLPLALFLAGMVVTLIGAGKKILHYENADSFLIAGIAIECAALLSIIIILFIYTSKNRTQ